MRALLSVAGAKDTDFAAFDAAFVHESAVGEKLASASNERLEFLGDGLLGAAVARSLYERYPDASEGELALRKSSLVADSAIAATAERLGFDPLLVTGSALAQLPVERRRSLLADAFEAFVAVLALECGDEVARAFVKREHIDVREHEAPVEDDPKTMLQEWSQRRFRAVPTYTESADGPDHARTFVATVAIDGVTAQGTGHSKKSAQRNAAAAILAILRERYDDIAPRTLSQASAAGAPKPAHATIAPPRAPKRTRFPRKKKAHA
jgi:ribonuclease-3